MPAGSITLDEAVDLTRTGDVWVFRGHTIADRVIQVATNSPVNHVGMSVVIDDLPPLMWHAELGNKLSDLWTGTQHRGVQLNDARESIEQWIHRYGKRCWLRQLTPLPTREQEDRLLRVIARMDGTPFPSTARLAGRWLRGRFPAVATRRRKAERRSVALETAYCAETVALTYEEMGLLATDKDANWFDPGSFWSGDTLPLTPGYKLGDEIAVE